LLGNYYNHRRQFVFGGRWDGDIYFYFFKEEGARNQPFEWGVGNNSVAWLIVLESRVSKSVGTATGAVHMFLLLLGSCCVIEIPSLSPM